MRQLLNPHGSDETARQFIIDAQSVIFLTHTVQMKPAGKDGCSLTNVYFLTHTVQMKR